MQLVLRIIGLEDFYNSPELHDSVLTGQCTWAQHGRTPGHLSCPSQSPGTLPLLPQTSSSLGSSLLPSALRYLVPPLLPFFPQNLSSQSLPPSPTFYTKQLHTAWITFPVLLPLLQWGDRLRSRECAPRFERVSEDHPDEDCSVSLSVSEPLLFLLSREKISAVLLIIDPQEPLWSDPCLLFQLSLSPGYPSLV